MRIRSVHPEQWTDPEFLTCSPLARLLALALRNEADDNGIFEWNPGKLKMRLLPGDNCEVSDLLAELEQTRQIAPYEAGGRRFGIIRNFSRFQSPRKPAFKHPVPDEMPEGFDLHSRKCGTGAEPVPYPCDTGTVAVHAGIGEGEGEGEGNGRVRGEGPSAPAPSENERDGFLEEWNRVADAAGLPVPRGWNKKRLAAFRARWRDPAWRATWREGLDRIPGSRFLTGKNARGWRADIDFFLREDSLDKILEGTYDDASRDLYRAGHNGDDANPFA
jgi:hypothetical protein